MKVLSERRYQLLLDERNRLRQQHSHLEKTVRTLKYQKEQLESKCQAEREELESQLETFQREHQKLRADLDSRTSEGIERAFREMGLSRPQIEKLQADRLELIELHIDKLYGLAKDFARDNREMRKNRGLFLVLVDRRNIVDENFSEFHDGQPEYLMQSQYGGVSGLPHIFSPQINDVFHYMGEKILLTDESGKITGHAERDGAVLIDLRGVAFRSCIMIEGVRTHRVHDKVERLQKGSAKHNAAIYASSLDEVMATIVVSEETSEVTLFRDGRFIKRYNPYTDVETGRDEKVVSIKRVETPARATTSERHQETIRIGNNERGRFLNGIAHALSGR